MPNPTQVLNIFAYGVQWNHTCGHVADLAIVAIYVRGLPEKGGMNTSSHLVVLKRIEVHLTYHFHSSLLLITHNLQTFPITPYKSEPSTL